MPQPDRTPTLQPSAITVVRQRAEAQARMNAALDEIAYRLAIVIPADPPEAQSSRQDIQQMGAVTIASNIMVAIRDRLAECDIDLHRDLGPDAGRHA